MKPSIGRIAHYHSELTTGEASRPFAAIVADVNEDDSVNLFLIDHSGSASAVNGGGIEGVPYSETPKPGHWSWPPRV